MNKNAGPLDCNKLTILHQLNHEFDAEDLLAQIMATPSPPIQPAATKKPLGSRRHSAISNPPPIDRVLIHEVPVLMSAKEYKRRSSADFVLDADWLTSFAADPSFDLHLNTHVSRDTVSAHKGGASLKIPNSNQGKTQHKKRISMALPASPALISAANRDLPPSPSLLQINTKPGSGQLHSRGSSIASKHRTNYPSPSPSVSGTPALRSASTPLTARISSLSPSPATASLSALKQSHRQSVDKLASLAMSRLAYLSQNPPDYCADPELEHTFLNSPPTPPNSQLSRSDSGYHIELPFRSPQMSDSVQSTLTSVLEYPSFVGAGTPVPADSPSPRLESRRQNPHRGPELPGNRLLNALRNALPPPPPMERPEMPPHFKPSPLHVQSAKRNITDNQPTALKISIPPPTIPQRGFSKDPKTSSAVDLSTPHSSKETPVSHTNFVAAISPTKQRGRRNLADPRFLDSVIMHDTELVELMDLLVQVDDEFEYKSSQLLV